MTATLRTYKFLVVPVVQQVDEHGTVVAELQPPQPDNVFGVDGLHRYADGFEAKLAAQLAELQNGGGPVERIPVPAER